MGETPTHNPNAKHQTDSGDWLGVFNDVKNKVTARLAEQAVSDDPRESARADRTRLKLWEIRMGGYKTPETPQEADQQFGGELFAGEEVADILNETLTGVDEAYASEVRERYELPDVGSAPSNAEAPEDPDEVLTTEEGPVAAVIIGTLIEQANKAAESGRRIKPEKLWGDETVRQRIEAAIRSANIVPGSRSAPREMIDRIYNKLPRLMRLAYKRQMKVAA